MLRIRSCRGMAEGHRRPVQARCHHTYNKPITPGERLPGSLVGAWRCYLYCTFQFDNNTRSSKDISLRSCVVPRVEAHLNCQCFPPRRRECYRS